MSDPKDDPPEPAPLILVMALIEKLAEKGILDAKDARQIIRRAAREEAKKKG